MVVVVGVVKFGYTTSAGLTLLPLLALGGVVLASPGYSLSGHLILGADSYSIYPPGLDSRCIKSFKNSA